MRQLHYLVHIPDTKYGKRHIGQRTSGSRGDKSSEYVFERMRVEGTSCDGCSPFVVLFVNPLVHIFMMQQPETDCLEKEYHAF